MNRFHNNKKTKQEAVSDWKSVSVEDQKKLVSFFEDEFNVASRNNDKINKDFEEYYNMMHGIRDAKPNAWEPDIYMPEFSSRILSQIGNFANQYFSSTDFVETDIDSDDPKDVAEGKAAKKLLNKLLNDKEVHYYQKIIRMLLFVFTCGSGVIKGSYSQEIEPVLSHYDYKSDYAKDPETNEFLAEDGSFFTDPTNQRAKFETIETPVYKENIIKDNPEFDVYPTTNVYMSPEYVYSLNDKEYIIFESEKTLDGLRADQDYMGYFNLDLLDQEEPVGQRGEKTYNRNKKAEEQDKPVSKTFIVYERWGKFPVIKKDEVFVPGLDKDGSIDKSAELAECIVYYVKNRETDNIRHMIGFKKSPHTKRPMVRFLCYVDMIDDNGFGDGEVNRELQKAINDNYNLMNYRTRLAVTPAFKGKKFSGLPDKIELSPENVVLMDNLDDLQEIDIKDNISGGVVHHNLLTSRMDYSMATAPQTMGMSPDRRETATMASIIDSRASVRIGMKSMNLEFIGFTDFYDMLLTLCNDFMRPQTLEDLLGEDAFNYNPKRKDKFKPVSQALETEEGKQFKIRTYSQMLSMVASMQNPKTPMVVNYILGQILETIGGSFKHFKKFMFEESPEANMLYQLATGAKSGGGQQQQQGGEPPTQNQQGLPQGVVEQGLRESGGM